MFSLPLLPAGRGKKRQKRAPKRRVRWEKEMGTHPALAENVDMHLKVPMEWKKSRDLKKHGDLLDHWLRLKLNSESIIPWKWVTTQFWSGVAVVHFPRWVIKRMTKSIIKRMLTREKEEKGSQRTHSSNNQDLIRKRVKRTKAPFGGGWSCSLSVAVYVSLFLGHLQWTFYVWVWGVSVVPCDFCVHLVALWSSPSASFWWFVGKI